MSRPGVVSARFLNLFRRQVREDGLEEEVRFHLDMQIEDNLKSGMNATEARNAALRSFGGIEPMKESYRDQWSFALIETTARDFRYALRALRKSPAFTVTAVAVLALAIGANTAMFSVLNAVLLRPLSYPSPEQLTMLWTEIPSRGVRESRSAYWNIEEWRRYSQSFASLAFFDPVSATLGGAAEPEHISVGRISANLFSLLGVQPLVGRTFTVDEAEQRQRVAMISHRLWQSRFGGSTGVIGESLELDGRPSRIIGVMPESLVADADVWEPYTLFPDWDALRRARGVGSWFVVGRLRPHVTIEQAQAEMKGIARRLDEQSPAADRNRGVSVTPLSLHVVGPRSRMALWMLTVAVLFILLIAATNVAGLSLARSTRREREMAVRAALGAGRVRILRQLLAESLTLAVIAGLLGLMLAMTLIRVILAVKPGNLARLNEVSLDPYALGWALALCLLTGILVGIAPAITLGRRNLRPATQESGRGIAGGVAASGTRRVLVVTEFALAIILLVGAGLLLRSLWSVQNVSLGFRPERVLSVQLTAPPSTAAAQWTNFYNSVLEEITPLAGVERAGIIGDLFIGGNPESDITVEGEAQTLSQRLRFRKDEVSEGLFKTLETPLLRGRFFSSSDGPDSPKTAIINETMGRYLWPGRDPIGKKFKLGPADSNRPWFTVVGVVGDMRRQGLEQEPIPQMFEPLAQNPSRLVTLLVRTVSDDPLKMVGAVRAAVRRVDTHAPFYAVTTLEGRLDDFLSARRFQTSLLIGFSITALFMAAIGIYGLIQYSIASRTHEIGIRIAVGAQSGEIFRMILGEGLKLTVAGLALGLAGYLLLARAGSSLLFGVSTTDPLTLAVVSLLLIVVAAAACYFPARRAMQIDPIVALRHE